MGIVNDKETNLKEALIQMTSGMNIGDLSRDKQDELVIKMTEILLKRIFIETMDKLGNQGRGEYEKMTEGEVAPETIEAFFKEKIHDYDEMVQKIIEDFSNEMMAANK